VALISPEVSGMELCSVALVGLAFMLGAALGGGCGAGADGTPFTLIR
jgi:hypothetical protein